MIVIQKGQANNVVLTLKEKSTLLAPYYLFEFKNDQENESIYFLAEDVSDQIERYNKFSITETDTPDYSAGEVDLELTGFWSYIIREQASSTNLDPDLSGVIVEVGKVKVLGTSIEPTRYDSMEKTNKVYNG
jgi:hypothetical protein